MKKNLLKKVLAMTVTVAMLGGLVACGSASNDCLLYTSRTMPEQEKVLRERLQTRRNNINLLRKVG